jgi:cobalamin biosynthesis Co2+ chelatase CbiK
MINEANFFYSACEHNLDKDALKAFVAVGNIKSYPQLCFVLDAMVERNLIEYLRAKDWKALAKKYFAAGDDDIIDIRLENAYEAFRKVAQGPFNSFRQ